MRYCWTTLHVTDMDRSLAFYRDLLGLRVDSLHGDNPRVAMLGEPGGPMLELLYEQDADSTDLGRGVNVGYMVDDLDATKAHIEMAGFAVSGILSPGPGVRFCFVTDPDGFSIQLVGRA